VSLSSPSLARAAAGLPAAGRFFAASPTCCCAVPTSQSQISSGFICFRNANSSRLQIAIHLNPRTVGPFAMRIFFPHFPRFFKLIFVKKILYNFYCSFYYTSWYNTYLGVLQKLYI
jgi:hypothetical protein